MASTNQELLAQPLTLANGAVIRNRLAKSAMSEALGTTGNRVTEGLAHLYGRWAEGGIGLQITGNVMVDARALGEPNNVVLENAVDMELLKLWATAGSQQGAQVWMQLNHPGKQSPKGLNIETVAPSAVSFGNGLQRYFTTPRELTASEIEDLVQRFAKSAALAKQAGFGGVQIHGAHGYLVSQFLSAHHNRRQDDWGGSAVKRRRFVLAIYDAMRKEVGPRFPIGIKLNSADFQRGGFTEEESLEVIQALSEAGMDLIEVSGGTYESPKMSQGLSQRESTRAREAYFLYFAEKVRAVTKTPLMVTGGFRTSAGMAEALRDGSLDLIGLARPLAIEPDFPHRLLAGEEGRHPVPSRISTGIRAIDEMALMEVAWYSRQLRRMAEGKDPVADEGAIKSLLMVLLESGWKTFKTRRLRA